VGLIITLSRQEQCTKYCCLSRQEQCTKYCYPQSYVRYIFVQTLQVSSASNHSTIASYLSLAISEVCVPVSTIIINPPLLTSELHLAGLGTKDILLSVLDPTTANEAYHLTKQTSLLTQANELTRTPVSVF
jgi:hypothetical protein